MGIDLPVIDGTGKVNAVQVDRGRVVIGLGLKPCAVILASIKVVVGQQIDTVVAFFAAQCRRDGAKVGATLSLSAFVVGCANPCN